MKEATDVLLTMVLVIQQAKLFTLLLKVSKLFCEIRNSRINVKVAVNIFFSFLIKFTFTTVQTHQLRA